MRRGRSLIMIVHVTHVELVGKTVEISCFQNIMCVLTK